MHKFRSAPIVFNFVPMTVVCAYEAHGTVGIGPTAPEDPEDPEVPEAFAATHDEFAALVFLMQASRADPRMVPHAAFTASAHVTASGTTVVVDFLFFMTTTIAITARIAAVALDPEDIIDTMIAVSELILDVRSLQYTEI